MTSLTRSGSSVVRRVAETGVGWRSTVEELTQTNLAHAPEWFTVIRDAYGHEPLYLTTHDADGRPGLLPAFIVRRPFLGTVVTSMPFLDSGGPACGSPGPARSLVEHLVGEARRAGASLVELRCTEHLDLGCPPMETKVNLVLALPSDPDRLWRQLNAGVRNQIRKAQRAGLSVEFGRADKLGVFYDAFARRMRDLGSPVHGLGFIGAVLDAFDQQARIALIRMGQTPVGGLVALAFKDSLVVPWATCRKEYLSLCSNMLLYWETLRAACREGFRRFEFGRSTRDSGTYRFKRQWGAHEEPLFWYTIPLRPRTSQPRSRAGATAALAVKVWQHLPVSLSRLLGPPIRKYLTQ